MSPLKEIVGSIQLQVVKIPYDMKVRAAEYDDVVSQLSAISRKQSGRLAVHDLSNLDKLQELINLDFLMQQLGSS